jgi:branched-chain amino acid transport system permease protein
MIVMTLVVGLVLGGTFALMALGQTIQYDRARIANLAFGQLVVGGSFLNYLMIIAIGMEPAGAFAILTPLGFAVSYLLYPLAKRPGQPARLGSDATLNAVGLMFLLESIYTISTSDAFAGNNLPELSADIFGIETSASQFMGLVLTMLMGVALYTTTRTGRWPFALRATLVRAQFPPQISTGDYKQERMTFAIGGALAVIVGVIWSIYPPSTPMSGAFLTTKLLVVVVSGARGNLPCTLAAGLILALSEAGVSALLEPNLALTTTCNNFLLMLLG